MLGSSGSYGAPAGGACSGYLVRSGGTAIWMDCGNGTLANLQRHCGVEDLDAVVITHVHPDHCVDLYGLHVLMLYGLDRRGLPVFAPGGTEKTLGALVGGDWGGAFAWNEVADGDRAEVGATALRFSRTHHPPPTLAVEITGDGKRLVYTADTGPDWSPEAFGPGADLLLSEATYQDTNDGYPFHLTARQAGIRALEAKARRLMLTHLWPRLDPRISVEEGEEGFGRPLTLAAPHLITTV